MVTVNNQGTEVEELVAIIGAASDGFLLDGLEGFSETDKDSIADALKRLPQPGKEGSRWKIKPPTITKMVWWR